MKHVLLNFEIVCKLFKGITYFRLSCIPTGNGETDYFVYTCEKQWYLLVELFLGDVDQIVEIHYRKNEPWPFNLKLNVVKLL